MSAKNLVIGIAATLGACVVTSAAAQLSPSIVVAGRSQDVQTPASGGAGLSFTQSGSGFQVEAYTEGFLFCGVVPQGQYSKTLTLKHEDQSFSQPHPWTFAPVTVDALDYSSGVLDIPAELQSSLTCLANNVDGSVATSFSDGLFDNGYESATVENYANLVNWIPPRGFSWFDPDWNLVPIAACDPTAAQTPQVVEDVGCAAATGVASDASGLRAATMWTATDGFSFTYVFRVDARFGPQAPGAQPRLVKPSKADASSPDGSTGMTVLIQDAFEGGDTQHVGYLSSSGQWCVLTALPTQLNSTVCAQASPIAFDGALNASLTVGGPFADADQAFYVAVTRQVQGGHLSLTTPIVAASVLMDPAIVAEGGDRFVGDNVVFGFQPTSHGFPWMSGQ